MKLTYLGTSHGVPAADRYTSCYMLEAGENHVVLTYQDPNAPVCNGLRLAGVLILAWFATERLREKRKGIKSA